MNSSNTRHVCHFFDHYYVCHYTAHKVSLILIATIEFLSLDLC